MCDFVIKKLYIISIVCHFFTGQWSFLLTAEFLACVWSVLSENDVAAIDVNMGCPKEFSIKVLQLHSSVYS